MRDNWRFLEMIPADGYFQMALDEVLFEHFLDQSTPGFHGLLRFYEFPVPTVTLGRFQPFKALPQQILEGDFDLVRRPTAGGMVTHTESLTFTIIARTASFISPGNRRGMIYNVVHQWVQAAFQSLGIPLMIQMQDAPQIAESAFQVCFSSPVEADLMWQDKKILGGAQKHARHHFLHQGDIHLAALGQAGNGEFKRSLIREIKKVLQRQANIRLCERNLSEIEEMAAVKLATEKYRSALWSERH